MGAFAHGRRALHQAIEIRLTVVAQKTGEPACVQESRPADQVSAKVRG